jgi:pyruvate kinase
VVCRVDRGGALSDNKGVNLPNAWLSIDPLTQKDRDDLRLGLELGVDYVALSFVQGADDIRKLKQLLGAAVRPPLVVAKIERPQAIAAIDEIIAETDAIMVARGDLGVEMAVEQVPPLQKRVIQKCNAAGVPVITATQMLESMMQSPRPTRAEASDVANAVLDGTDAVMLSGETASGEFPIEAVETMRRIVSLIEAQGETPWLSRRRDQGRVYPDGEAIAYASCHGAEMVDAQAIITFTQTGSMARRVAKFRPSKRIIAVTSNESTFRQMALVWGIEPVLIGNIESDIAQAARRVIGTLRDEGRLHARRKVLVTAGVPFEDRRETNTLLIELV